MMMILTAKKMDSIATVSVQMRTRNAGMNATGVLVVLTSSDIVSEGLKYR